MFKHALAAATLCLLSGCLISQSSNTTHSGTRVSPEAFAQVKLGETTTGWVTATLGAPSSVSRTGDDEIWKYVYNEHTDSDGRIFLIFAGSNSSDKTENAFFEFKNGIVVNKWRS